MSPENRTFVIAEFGSNHMSSYQRAIEAPSVFADCGADAIKYQLFKLEDILHDISDGERATELNPDWLPDIAAACKEHSIEFMCTPFSEWAVEALKPFVKRWKIAAFEQKRRHIWAACLRTRMPIIASFGRHEPDKELIERIRNVGGVPLYCVSKYPTEDEEVYLRTMERLNTEYECDECGAQSDAAWGFSDHTRSLIIPALAVAMGASVIEKHVCLDYAHEGPDMPHSLDPEDFAEMVGNIRLADLVCHRDPPAKPLRVPYPNRRE